MFVEVHEMRHKEDLPKVTLNKIINLNEARGLGLWLRVVAHARTQGTGFNSQNNKGES